MKIDKDYREYQKAKHNNEPHSRYCSYCDMVWPCDTREMIEGWENAEAE